MIYSWRKEVPNESMLTLQINMLIFYDGNGQMAWGRIVDLETESFIPIDDVFLRPLSQYPELIFHRMLDSKVVGILQTATDQENEQSTSDAESHQAYTEPADIADEPVADGVRALLVEDNPVNLFVGRAILEKLGCSITVANDGQEAIDEFQRGSFDIVLMDCHMPVINGFEATCLIRQWEKDQARRRTPIIALTADTLDGVRERCLRLGMDDYRSKPVRIDQLADVLQRYSGDEGQRVA